MYRQHYPEDPGMHNLNMEPDTVTRVTYRNNPGFLQRIGNSLMGIVVGLVLIVVASGLLYWNEGRAVYTAQSLEEGLRVVHSLRNPDVVLDENNGKLVHLTGQLKTRLPLKETVHGITIKAVKLKREVEMLQWVEHETRREINEGDRTRTEITYSYSKEWRSELIKTSSFAKPSGHDNPLDFPMYGTEMVAVETQVGGFYLSKGLVNKISVFHDFKPTLQPENTYIKLTDYGYFHGEKTHEPKVGDMKVKFLYAGLTEENSQYGHPDRVSIIAQQDRHFLKEYKTGAGNDLEILYMGDLNAKEIIDKEHATNNMMTWGLRMAGWIVMFIAFQLMTSLIYTLVDWIPLLRDLVAMSVLMMNVCLAISLSLTVIAIGWIRYRPLLALAILVCAAAPLVISKVRASSTGYRRSRMD